MENGASLSSSTSSLATNAALKSNVPGDRNSIATVTSNGSADANVVDLDKMFAFLGDLQKSDSRLSIATLANEQTGQSQQTSSSTPSTTITSPSLIANCSSNGDQPSPSIGSLASVSSSGVSSAVSSAISSTTLTVNKPDEPNHNGEDIESQFDQLLQNTERQLNELEQIHGNLNHSRTASSSPFNPSKASLPLNNNYLNANKCPANAPNQCFRLPPAYKHALNPGLSINSSESSRPSSLASDGTLNSYSCSDQTSLNSSLNSSNLPMFRLNQFNRQPASNHALTCSPNPGSKPSSQCSNHSSECNLKFSSNSSIYSTSSSYTNNDQSSSSTTTLADLMQQSEQQLRKQNQHSRFADESLEKCDAQTTKDVQIDVGGQSSGQLPVSQQQFNAVNQCNQINSQMNCQMNGQMNGQLNGQMNGQQINGQQSAFSNQLDAQSLQQVNAANQLNNQINSQMNGQVYGQTNDSVAGTLLLNAALQQRQQQFIANAMAKGMSQQQVLASLQQQNLMRQSNGQQPAASNPQIDERRKQRVERKMQQLQEEERQQQQTTLKPSKQLNGSPTNDLAEFAEKYFNSHPRDGPGNSSMIKTLTRRKRTADDVEVFSKTEMLSYTPNFSIPTSHIRMQEQENAALACSMFKELCKYMSQELKPDAEQRVLQSILGKCIEREELRDELYVQMMRQITNNANREEIVRLWVLICLATASFTPSKLLARYFVEFLRRNLRKESAISCYAQFSLDNLRPKGAVVDCRRMAASSQEINAVKNLSSLLVKFHLLDGSTKTVSQTDRLLVITLFITDPKCDDRTSIVLSKLILFIFLFSLSQLDRCAPDRHRIRCAALSRSAHQSDQFGRLGALRSEHNHRNREVHSRPSIHCRLFGVLGTESERDGKRKR